MRPLAFAHPAGGFNGPRPTGFPDSSDNDADIEKLAAHSRSDDTPHFPFPMGGSPPGFLSGIARPTGGRGHHRGGKGHHSGAAFPTGSFSTPDGRPSNIPSTLPDFTMAKRQASMGHRAPVHSRKHGKPSGIPAGIAPPSRARPTGYRPFGPRPSGLDFPAKPSGAPRAEIEKRQDDEEFDSNEPSRSKPSGAFPPPGARPTGTGPSGPCSTSVPHGARPSAYPVPSGFVTSAVARA